MTTEEKLQIAVEALRKIACWPHHEDFYSRKVTTCPDCGRYNRFSDPDICRLALQKIQEEPGDMTGDHQGASEVDDE